ncbi:type II secretion system protein GspM [Serratia ureilytica]
MPQSAAAREQLPERLRQSALAYRIAIAELTESEADVRVTLPPVPFERLLPWLAALQREHGSACSHSPQNVRGRRRAWCKSANCG